VGERGELKMKAKEFLFKTYDQAKEYAKENYPELFTSDDDNDFIIEILQKFELNTCDKCSCVDSTYDLIWLDYLEEEEYDRIKDFDLPYTALCISCAEQYGL
jgi:hypothetical protein